ncbi:MAG: hypothetical protein KatS3mg117_2237 [Geminicoccaceae bacterium]|nr:MAG: hypothetical protein KatS3mg117_2237 [Geminicoccaceae bacterium]
MSAVMARTRPTSTDRLRRALCAALAATLLSFPGIGPAAAGAGELDARYRVSVAGIPIAELGFAFREAEGALESRLLVRAVGLAAAWNGARSELATVGRLDGAGRPLPARFTSRVEKRDRDRAVEIRYDPAGAVAAVEITSRGRKKASEVPPELRVGTVDPLTAFARLRVWLEQAVAGRAGPAVTVPVFDGRKRLDLEARYVGRAPAPDGENGEVLELAVRLVGIFGFDEDDELIHLPDGDEPAPLRVLVRADGSFLPLRLDVPDRRAGPVIELVRDCQRVRCPAQGG